jgi:hypothetical protein
VIKRNKCQKTSFNHESLPLARNRIFSISTLEGRKEKREVGKVKIQEK